MLPGGFIFHNAKFPGLPMRYEKPRKPPVYAGLKDIKTHNLITHIVRAFLGGAILRLSDPFGIDDIFVKNTPAILVPLYF